MLQHRVSGMLPSCRRLDPEWLVIYPPIFITSRIGVRQCHVRNGDSILRDSRRVDS
jgi:hypothetical protein